MVHAVTPVENTPSLSLAPPETLPSAFSVRPEVEVLHTIPIRSFSPRSLTLLSVERRAGFTSDRFSYTVKYQLSRE